MKSIKQFALVVLGATFFSIALSSCSNDDASTQEVVETGNIKAKSLGYTTEYKMDSKSGQQILTVVNSSVLLKAGTDEATLKKTIVSNKANIEISHYIDGQLAGPSIVISNGNLTTYGVKYPNSGLCPTCDHDSDGNISDNTDCSTKGLQQCAYSTYQQWSTLHIVAASLDGEAAAVLDGCILRNCLGW